MSEKPEPQEPRKLKAAFFRTAVATNANAYVAIGDKGVISLQPAAIGADGDWYAIDKGQTAQGLGIRRKVGLHGRETVERSFVPFGNIDELRYGA